MNNLFNKKSQVTVFVILGIIVLGIILLLFFIKKPSVKVVDESLDANVLVQKYLDSCLESASKETIVRVFSQGGHYYFNSEDHIIFNDAVIPTYESLPSVEFINSELSFGLGFSFLECIDLRRFEDREIFLNNTGNFYAPKSQLTKNAVLSTVDYEITGTYNGKSFVLTKSVYISDPKYNKILFEGIELKKTFVSKRGQSINQIYEFFQQNKNLDVYAINFEDSIYDVISINDNNLGLNYSIAVKRVI